MSASKFTLKLLPSMAKRDRVDARPRQPFVGATSPDIPDGFRRDVKHLAEVRIDPVVEELIASLSAVRMCDRQAIENEFSLPRLELAIDPFRRGGLIARVSSLFELPDLHPAPEWFDKEIGGALLRFSFEDGRMVTNEVQFAPAAAGNAVDDGALGSSARGYPAVIVC
jgi:hypothetical protein